MEIKVSLKHMGKRKKSVEARTYSLFTTPSTVRELILAVVEAGVGEYNKRLDNQQNEELLKCLTRREIEDKGETGKISFGTLYGEKKADLKQAQDNAIQCFEDGIYRIFLDGRPLESLDEEIGTAFEEAAGREPDEKGDRKGADCGEENGPQQGVFTFVRLTMLSGRVW